MAYTEKDLPTTAEIFSKLPLVDSSTASTIDGLKAWAFEKTLVIKTLIGIHIEKMDYKEDPDAYQDKVLKYHLLLSGISGLAEALYEKSTFICYKQLTEASKAAPKEDKLTAGDRSVYAQNSTSSLKGLRKDIEETLSNLEMRSSGWKMSSNRRW